MSRSRSRVESKDLNGVVREGQSIELLKRLHLLTRDGALNADSLRKLKQVYHFLGFIEAALQKEKPEQSELQSHFPKQLIVDLGAGKSYLGFLAFDLLFKKLNQYQLVCVEKRQALVSEGQSIAESLRSQEAWNPVSWIQKEINELKIPDLPKGVVSMILALHACDTATDQAIDFGIESHAKFMFLAPCCQAEISRALPQKSEVWASLYETPLHRREYGSHLTNVLRRLRLEANGYWVTVTELVGWEHSLKNELIIAQKKGSALPEKIERYNAFLKWTGVLSPNFKPL